MKAFPKCQHLMLTLTYHHQLQTHTWSLFWFKIQSTQADKREGVKKVTTTTIPVHNSCKHTYTSLCLWSLSLSLNKYIYIYTHGLTRFTKEKFKNVVNTIHAMTMMTYECNDGSILKCMPLCSRLLLLLSYTLLYLILFSSPPFDSGMLRHDMMYPMYGMVVLEVKITWLDSMGQAGFSIFFFFFF